jgi:hypothetical protein
MVRSVCLMTRTMDAASLHRASAQRDPQPFAEDGDDERLRPASEQGIVREAFLFADQAGPTLTGQRSSTLLAQAHHLHTVSVNGHAWQNAIIRSWDISDVSQASATNSRSDGNVTMSALRPGAKVRVVEPRSRFFGATGFVIGRSDMSDQWFVRFTTLGVTTPMLDEEIEVIAQQRRSTASDPDPGSIPPLPL